MQFLYNLLQDAHINWNKKKKRTVRSFRDIAQKILNFGMKYSSFLIKLHTTVLICNDVPASKQLLHLHILIEQKAFYTNTNLYMLS